MKKTIEFYQKRYQLIWNEVPWQPYPLHTDTMFCMDDVVIRKALVKLNQVDPSTPTPEVMEQAEQNLHFVTVNYEDDFSLYWFSHYIEEGDRGYVLYRFQNFVANPVNFLDFGRRFKLPDESTAKVYMEIFSRLNEWAKLLELPYRYEVVLEANYMGFQKNYDQPVMIPEVSKAQPNDITSKGNALVVARPTFWSRLLARLNSHLP